LIKRFERCAIKITSLRITYLKVYLLTIYVFESASKNIYEYLKEKNAHIYGRLVLVENIETTLTIIQREIGV